MLLDVLFMCCLGASSLLALKTLMASTPLQVLTDAHFSRLLKQDDELHPVLRPSLDLLMLGAPPDASADEIPKAFKSFLSATVVKPTGKMLEGFTQVWRTGYVFRGQVEVHIDSGSHAGGVSRFGVKCRSTIHPPCDKGRQANAHDTIDAGVAYMAAWAFHGDGLSRSEHVGFIPSADEVAEFELSVTRVI